MNFGANTELDTQCLIIVELLSEECVTKRGKSLNNSCLLLALGLASNKQPTLGRFSL